ncbi:MAG: hypothetical protein NZ739_00095 [Verrucomicrobiae bacterium]|nr:hypothetical protein [Verrucomicrobiae bacterium]MDW7980508.1 hypothetical protein [Verrucomicrobiales bacterium]
MKPTLSLALALGLCICSVRPGQCAEAAQYPKSLPGAEIAQTISMITGVAISPLLGVSAVGAWQYFKAKTPEQKAALPWFARPSFWVPALLIVLACFLKDTLGAATPAVLKKPLDVAEAIENKLSGMLATCAFVPVVAAIFGPAHAQAGSAESACLGSGAINLSWLYNALMVPISMAAFLVVFIASNVINVLILLSPFPPLDAALKAFRLFLLSTVTVTALANPWIGAAWAIALIILAYLIAGWSFRFTVLGAVFVWDFITRRHKRFRPDPVANWMFLGRRTSKVPVRTYGKLIRTEDGRVCFRYRPWLVLPPHEIRLPEARYEVGRGMFYSEIIRVEEADVKTVFILPPRYRTHEHELAEMYGFAGVRPIGLRAVLSWLKSAMGLGRRAKEAAA